MFKQQSEKANFKEVETIIGPSVKVKGNFNGQGNIIVEGALEGSLKTAGNVFIGDKAKIIASISAQQAKIGGEVNGNIKVKKSLDIVASAKIFGDIECSSLSVEPGAILNGKCTMATSMEKKKQEEAEITS
ncbi:MAG: polymer-forming cytoskeletal protein [Patescibacteria group bacterium]